MISRMMNPEVGGEEVEPAPNAGPWRPWRLARSNSTRMDRHLLVVSVHRSRKIILCGTHQQMPDRIPPKDKEKKKPDAD